MLKKITLLLALALSFIATTALADDFPDEIVDKFMAMKADAEAKKVMPESLSGMTVVSTAEVNKMFQAKKAIFLDNRVKSQYDTEKIKGATWFLADDLLKNPDLAKKLDKDKEYVLYCNGPTCFRSPATGVMLNSLGFKKLYWYRDGIPAWKKAGNPVE